MVDFVVIESGGTKSTWAFGSYNSGLLHTVETVGLHPQELTPEKTTSIKKVLEDTDVNSSTQFFFYGAGCSHANQPLIHAFFLQFSIDLVTVRTDLEGACIALFSNKPGFTAILGTGAIAAEYDGNHMVRYTSGLGYLLGDEGSGYDIGKRLLKFYFDEKLSNTIQLEIEDYFGGKEHILSTIYRNNGRMIIAGLAKIVHSHKAENQIRSLIYGAFHDFYTTALEKLGPPTEVSFVGSIAYYFKDELQEVLAQKDITIKQISQTAIQGLFQHHFISS